MPRPRVPVPDKPAAFYLPEGFNERDYFQRDELDDDGIDSLRYFIHLIRWKRIMGHADDRGFVRLKFDYLARIIQRDLVSLFRLRLHDGRVLDLDKGGSALHKSWGFKFREPFASAKWYLHRCESEAVNYRIAKVVSESFDHRRKQPVHDWLDDRLTHITIDPEEAERVIQQMRLDYDPAALPPGSKKPKSDNEYRDILRAQVQLIVDGQWATIVCPYGRYHSPITRLCGDLRKLLRFDSEPLVGLDVANSQPLFLGLVAREYYKNGMAKKRLLERAFAEDEEDPYRYGGNGVLTGPGNNSGVERYVDVCQRGAFYESLMDGGITRDQVKVNVFREVFFGKNTAKEPRPLLTLFRRRFPDVTQVLKELKRKDYRHSAYVLQNAESTLCIGRICGRLMREHPALPLVTVHDSWYTTEGNVGVVRRVIEEEFSKVGLVPTVR